MNVLIIGGTRFFGIPMVDRILDNGHNVTIATRGSHGNPFSGRVCHVIMDKTNESSVKKAIGDQEYDVIIDKVAYSSNDVSSLLKNVHCKRYIQMSSCAVYNVEHLLISENEFDTKNMVYYGWTDRQIMQKENDRLNVLHWNSWISVSVPLSDFLLLWEQTIIQADLNFMWSISVMKFLCILIC